MKLSIRPVLVGIAALSLGLSGCGEQHPTYNLGLKYAVRTDPILRSGSAKDLGDERYDADQPGVFPVMKLDDAFKAGHPYHAKMFDEANVRLAAFRVAEKKVPMPKGAAGEERKKIDDQRKAIQEEYIPKIKANPAAFKREIELAMDKVMRSPTLLTDADRKSLADELEAMFGTPANPKINAKAAKLDEAALNNFKLDDKTLAMGSTRYRVHCLHCHGVPGDGRGPTARWINPHPRDFRAGLFKFHSVDQTSRSSRPPSRADLMRTLRKGIEGTAMPTFNLLKDDELESLVSYVIHLSVRGKVESTVIMNDFELDDETQRLAFKQGIVIKDRIELFTGKFMKEGWLDSNKPTSAIKVVAYPKDYPNDPSDPDYVNKLKASVKRGQEIFNATPSDEMKKGLYDRLFPARATEAKEAAKAKAIEDAEAKAIEDAENKAIEKAKKENKEKKELTDEEIAKIKASINKNSIDLEVEKTFPELEKELQEKVAARVLSTLTAAKCVSCHTDYGRQARFRFDEWGTLVRPQNLPMGNLRGGKRPVDIYYRIHSGIPGSEMTPFGKTFEGNEQYIWDLVNFVTNVPYPTMRNQLDLRLD